MANPDLGRCACPVCAGNAALRETIKRKAYVVCENCGVQIFARGHESDSLLRRLGGPLAGGAERAEPGPAASAPPVEPPAKQPPAQPAAPVVTVRTHSSDGGTLEDETTIFDLLGKWAKK